MRFFLTGATGYIGSAVLEAGLRAGHQVTALVRDPEKAEHVSARGGTAVIGELSKPASYAAAAEQCDALIHTAFETLQARTERRSPGDRNADGRGRTTRGCRASGVRRLHVGHLGARRHTRCRRRRGAAQSHAARVLATRARGARPRRVRAAVRFAPRSSGPASCMAGPAGSSAIC